VFEDESSALLVLVIVCSGEVCGSIAASILINRQFRRSVICCVMLSICRFARVYFVVYLFLADENEKSVSIASFGDNGYICESRVYANQ
jgi:hypothetical protein